MRSWQKRNCSNCKLQLTSKLHAWNGGAPSFSRLDVWTPNQVPVVPFKPGFLWFCYFCQQHLDSSKNRAWNSLMRSSLTGSSLPSGPELLSSSCLYQPLGQFILYGLINRAPVKMTERNMHLQLVFTKTRNLRQGIGPFSSAGCHTRQIYKSSRDISLLIQSTDTWWASTWNIDTALSSGTQQPRASKPSSY